MPNRSPITDSIKRVNEAIAYLQNTLNPGEIDLLLDELAPLPEPEPEVKQAKRTRKKPSTSKSSQSSSKSPRASGMAAQLKERRQEQRQISTEDVDAAFCAAPNCGEGLTNPIHDPNGGYGSYHPFVGNVPPALAPSPADSGVVSTTRNSEASAASAGAVTGGSSE